MSNESSPASLQEAAEIFLGVRHRLFGIAYRILNSRADAEDIVQEAWLRWQMCDRDAVVDPQAFLATTTARLCINTLQTAHARYEIHSSPWLSEHPDASADPVLAAEQCEELELGTTVLLERLSPTERAAFVLRKAFDYPYGRIASIVGVTQQNARQLVSRARRHLVVESEGHKTVGSAERLRLFDAFVAAARGDLIPLETVFAEDAAGARVPIAA